MKFTYRLMQDRDTWVAECLEADAEGEGKTEHEAIESLKKSLEEHMFRPDAVAPPSRPTESPIQLVRVA
jgi:hypothetical protein